MSNHNRCTGSPPLASSLGSPGVSRYIIPEPPRETARPLRLYLSTHKLNMSLATLKVPAGWYALHLPVTDSTMLRLKEPDLTGRPEPFVLLTTDYQTAGRGQRGTHWESREGQNLLFGLRFTPQGVAPDQQFALSEVLALAVAEALDEYTDGISVKWPNDIYWRDRKLCGMLLEHELQGGRICSTLTGVGINVNQRSFESDAPNPVSLRQITGRDTDRAQLMSHIVERFIRRYDQLQSGDRQALHADYMNRLYRRGEWAPYRDDRGTFEGMITDVSPLGLLHVSRRDGTGSSYAFKEVAYELTETKR